MRDWKFKDSDFDNIPVYEGLDLGITWTGEKTFIRIWAPTAQRVFFRIYRDGQGGEPVREFPLLPDEQGTWIYEIREDLDGWFYTVQVRDKQGWLKEGPDIYAKATGVNGHRGMIINPKKSDPPLWENDLRHTLANPCDIVIYEVHIRDFSMSPSSGITNKGKYLGFTEKGTMLPTG